MSDVIPEEEVCPVHCMARDFCSGIDHHGLEPCPERPEALRGAPIGQYHCPHCGCMVIAGMPHAPHDDGCALGLDVPSFWAAMDVYLREQG